MRNVVGVIHSRDNEYLYYFYNVHDIDLEIGDLVVVDTVNGPSVVEVRELHHKTSPMDTPITKGIITKLEEDSSDFFSKVDSTRELVSDIRREDSYLSKKLVEMFSTIRSKVSDGSLSICTLEDYIHEVSSNEI